jgi:hypothetical protein
MSIAIAREIRLILKDMVLINNQEKHSVLVAVIIMRDVSG